MGGFTHLSWDRSVGFGKRRKENCLPSLIDHLGAWEGVWFTFLEPDELFDESPFRATIERDADGFVIEYSGSIGGEDVIGRLWWSEARGKTTVDWVDSWHTGGEHERLEGSGDAPPRSYEYGGDDPRRSRLLAEHTASINPQLDDTISRSPKRCNDHLNSQPIWAGVQGAMPAVMRLSAS